MRCLLIGRILLFSLLIFVAACQRTESPPAEENPPLTAPVPASPVPTFPTPTETSMPPPIATVIRNDVVFYEGPFGHLVQTESGSGGVRMRDENIVLRESLPVDMELRVLGQYADCSVLNVILPDGTTGWVNVPSIPIGIQNEQNVRLNFECSVIPQGIYRPWTGPLTRNFGVREDSNLDQLLIENQTPSDVLIILTDTEETPMEAAYLRAGDSFSISLMGERFLFAALGEDWLVNPGRFRNTLSQAKLLETISQHQEWIILGQPGQEHTTYTLTLSGLWIGEAPEGWINVAKFPVIHFPAPFVITPGP